MFRAVHIDALPKEYCILLLMLLVYTKSGCPWCRDVVDFLHEKKVAFEEREVRGSKVFMDEMVKKSGQTKAPTLDLDGEILADTDRDAVETFLKSHGILK